MENLLPIAHYSSTLDDFRPMIRLEGINELWCFWSPTYKPTEVSSKVQFASSNKLIDGEIILLFQCCAHIDTNFTKMPIRRKLCVFAESAQKLVTFRAYSEH